MIELEKYWTMVTINTKGHAIPVEQRIAKGFLSENFPALVNQTDVSEANDEYIQTNLWRLCRVQEPEIRYKAALNLRCYISHEVKNACVKLFEKFKNNPCITYKPTCEELFQYVLDDAGKLIRFILVDDERLLQFDLIKDELNKEPRLLVLDSEGRQQEEYYPFTFKVLARFDPNLNCKESLRNWTYRLVTQYLNKILSQQEIYIINPWHFLSKITPEQLKKIENFYKFPIEQIKQDTLLIKLLREVNHQERFQQIKTGIRKKGSLEVQNPLVKEIFARLQEHQIKITSIKRLVDRLKTIFNCVCEYKNKLNTPILSVDKTTDDDEQEKNFLHETIPCTKFMNDLDELDRLENEQFYYKIQENFQPLYHQIREELLDKALKETIFARLTFLRNSRRLAPKYSKFIPAIRHFYRDRLAQGEIAPLVELRDQNDVSRLLDLKNLIIDAMQRMLALLHDTFLDWVRNSVELELAQKLKEQPDIWRSLLKEETLDIARLFVQALAEIHNSKNRSRNSLVAQKICYLLDQFI